MLRRALVALTVTATLPLVVGAIAATPAFATGAGSDRLTAGQGLNTGQRLQTSNGYRLIMQSDGNAVVYNPSNAVRFQTHTSGPAARMVLQSDGNLVVYSGSRALWANHAHGANALLVMQGDGNLVEYVANRPVWTDKTAAPPSAPAATDTLRVGARLNPGQQLLSTNHAYRFVMQGDGNAVIYGPAGVRDATGTGGHSGAYLIMQSDGNAVIYGPGALWQTGTGGHGGNCLVMQSDGNLVLYSATGALFVRPTPATTPTPPPPPPPGTQYGIIPGAYCTPPGATGYSSAGNRYICSYYSSDGRYHWKRA